MFFGVKTEWENFINGLRDLPSSFASLQSHVILFGEIVRRQMKVFIEGPPLT